MLLVFVMLAAFLLQEKRLDPVQPRVRLTPRQYVRDFVDHPMLLKLGFVNMLRFDAFDAFDAADGGRGLRRAVRVSRGRCRDSSS